MTGGHGEGGDGAGGQGTEQGESGYGHAGASSAESYVSGLKAPHRALAGADLKSLIERVGALLEVRE